MIADQIQNKQRYQSINHYVKTALDFIAQHAEDREITDGTYELIPGAVTAHVVSRETIPENEVKMEIHKRFMDIHYILAGSEKCRFAPLPMIMEVLYDEQTDNGFFECNNSGEMVFHPGEFYAVWPMEPHQPLCNVTEERMPVRKIICKVNVD